MTTTEKAKLSYSVAEAAAATGMSGDTIKRAIRATDYSKWPRPLKAKKAGDETSPNAPYLILAGDLQSWLDSLPDA